MKMSILFLVISALAGMLSACNDEEVKTVDWYRANPDARDEKLEECKNNPGVLEDTPNCINASRTVSGGPRAK
jgi:hypothetical protein